MQKNEDKLKIEELRGYMSFSDSVIAAASEYEKLKLIKTNVTFLDDTLEGGLETGNFYLFLGPAKSGKSTFLRAAAFSIAKSAPVLYVNFEQMHRNFISKIHDKYFGTNFRELSHDDIESVWKTLKDLPKDPMYFVRWTDELDERTFNNTVLPKLQSTVDSIGEKHGQKPVVILENLSDVYKERTNKGDSLVNIVSQTATDVKTFCIRNEVAMLLAHHTGKIKGSRPELDDVRDSKRVVDLAHSIFCLFVSDAAHKTGEVEERKFKIAYLAGRGQEGYAQSEVAIGPKLELSFPSLT